jgi:hypothetical protein
MSIQGRKNKQARIKESVQTCLHYGAKKLALLIGGEHLIHRALNKKKNNPGGLLSK